jgi:transcriptional regulator GlxA family with amidase domain
MKKLIYILAMVLITNFALAQNGAKEAWFCQMCNSSCDEIQFDKGGKCNHCNMPLVKMTVEERQKQMKWKPMTVAFYLQDGVEVLDFAGPMEVFAYAGFKVFTVSRTKDPIKSQGILTIIPDYSIQDAPPSDIIAFFGGNSGEGFSKDVISWLSSRQASATYLFSVCTGAFALSKAGLLDNQTVTTFHLAIENLRQSTPKAKVLDNVRFVDNGKVITTAGISAGIDGALHLVSKLRGETIAKETAEYMEYDKWKPGEGLIVNK